MYQPVDNSSIKNSKFNFSAIKVFYLDFGFAASEITLSNQTKDPLNNEAQVPNPAPG